MSDYTPTIGLEIHAELKTKTKMFCDSKNDPDEKRPNVNICPVCMAHPGTLPVINKEAVKHVLRVGIAVEGAHADFTEFDRKNYFYPDIPKGYQISQYKYPLISGGTLEGVDITRIHLEEDTARSTHDMPAHAGGEGESLVDYNRAGVPLMELVTEPVVKDAEQALRFARELQRILRYLGASDANMEKGEMRVEANVSVSKTKEFGTKVEVKNLNSFRAVERAIAYEIKRQVELIESGGKVIQETRGWDENKQQTFSQRLKEGSEDYRYFPDPDLPKLKLSDMPELARDVLEKEMPELPSQKRERFRSWGIKQEDYEMYVDAPSLGAFIEAVADALSSDTKLIQLASNYVTSDIAGAYKETGLPEKLPIEPKQFAELINMAAAGDLSSRGAKDVLAVMLKEGAAESPRAIAEKKGLLQQSDEGALLEIVRSIIEKNPGPAAEYKGGKESAIQFLVGQGMKETKGSANPQVLKSLLEKELG